MKLIAYICVVWLSLSATLIRAETAPATEDIALKYVEVTLAHQTLLERLPPSAIPAIVTLHIDTNTITILQENPNAASIRRILQEINQSPKRILLSVTISETDDQAGTNAKIISRPTIFTMDRKPSKVYVPQKNGKYLQVEITPRFVEMAKK